MDLSGSRAGPFLIGNAMLQEEVLRWGTGRRKHLAGWLPTGNALPWNHPLLLGLKSSFKAGIDCGVMWLEISWWPGRAVGRTWAGQSRPGLFRGDSAYVGFLWKCPPFNWKQFFRRPKPEKRKLSSEGFRGSGWEEGTGMGVREKWGQGALGRHGVKGINTAWPSY
jgi:hypothetical protein